MSDPACETLFFPFRSSALALPGAGTRAVFLGASPCPDLEGFSPAPVLQTCSKAAADALAARGHEVLSEVEEDGAFDLALILAPKQAQEAKYIIARGVALLRPGGLLLCAAANHAGGPRLAGTVAEAGLEPEVLSKNKGRVVWAEKTTGIKADVIEAWRRGGEMQPVCGGAFVSQPGIFCWDRIDEGSALLAENLPQDFKGRGADFGCGYGFLAAHLLQQNPDVKALYCIDDDRRAVEACRRNTERFKGRAERLWHDLRGPHAALKNLDFVVMNPPFHSGKALDIALGRAMIGTAASALRPGGQLWMVANSGLPYEPVLQQGFSACRKIFEGRGYKIYCAEK